MLFEKQYILTQTIETETRYRTETRTDSEGNTYTVEVPYTYYICNVKLETLIYPTCPSTFSPKEQMGFYAAYMQTLGNRPDLFPNGSYPHASTPKEPTYYEIPPEALKDEAFAAMFPEAEKYVGYPYVWGGSSPSTSFDCSGFISWVINHSGWNVGRQTAQGLYNICTPVSPEQAKPGDLVFFVGTYDTAGMSHVGLYVGNSVMLHCGDPISYTTSIQATGSSIFIVTGVCLKRQKGANHYGMNNWNALKRILRKPRARSRSCKSSFGSWKRPRPNRKTCRSSSLCAAST